jgi:hypothetical protein
MQHSIFIIFICSRFFHFSRGTGFILLACLRDDAAIGGGLP